VKRYVLFLLCGVVACSEEAQPSKIVEIGAVIDVGTAFPTAANVISLAESQMNQALRKSSYKSLQFKIPVADGQQSLAIALPLAAAQVKAGAKAIVTSFSSIGTGFNKTHYDADTTNDLNVPIMCLNCTNPKINDPAASGVDAIETASFRNEKRWMFQGTQNQLPVTRLVADTLRRAGPNGGDVNGDGVFKISGQFIDDSPGLAQRDEIKNFAADTTVYPPPALPLSYEALLYKRGIDPASYNWNDHVTKLTDNKNEITGATDGYPDLVVMFDEPSLGGTTIIRNLRQMAPNLRIVGSHSYVSETILAGLGSFADGLECVSFLLADGESGLKFTSDLMATSGLEPTFRDAHYYDGAVVFMLAVAIAAASVEDPTLVTPEQVRDAVMKVSDPAGTVVRPGLAGLTEAIELIKAGKPINYEGASGPVNFTSQQTVRGRLAHFVVEKGKYVVRGQYDCVASEACPLIR
jgi:hypothetical protein